MPVKGKSFLLKHARVSSLLRSLYQLLLTPTTGVKCNAIVVFMLTLCPKWELFRTFSTIICEDSYDTTFRGLRETPKHSLHSPKNQYQDYQEAPGVELNQIQNTQTSCCESKPNETNTKRRVRYRFAISNGESNQVL